MEGITCLNEFSATKKLEQVPDRPCRTQDTYVIKDAPKVNQNRALMVMKPEIPDARRLHGAKREVKKAKTVRVRPMR